MGVFDMEQADGPNPLLRAPLGTPEPIRPAFDLRLLEGGYYLDGELPGSTKDNIAIEISGFQTLVISGTLQRAYPGPPPDFKPDSKVNAEEYYSVPMHVLLDKMLLEQTSARDEEAEETCFANASRAPVGTKAGEAAPSPHVPANRDGGAWRGQPATGVWNKLGGQGTQPSPDQRGDRNLQDGESWRGRPIQRDEGSSLDGRAQQGYGTRGRGRGRGRGQGQGQGRGRGRGRGRGEGIQGRVTIPRREEIQKMTPESEEDDDQPRQDEPEWKLAEREIGFFSRSFILDKPVDWNAAEVRYKDGILTIWLPLGSMPERPVCLTVNRD
ncbi:hypothetical protein BO94DRAFT_535753 [Aspergillus sclerotioniger CBS 115572]|uniref:SHSP domain-containing protein n=1 Tax=Aspergillus sclerotioniger CBS 115572 TaxID=1450535 RepID=A0A317WLN9_9EURO|nr:hypothetical protein BO94DRAFT_535753 [Aspergillus sclerotioniger CBS 115572]PWY86611.1 hypothetical protein BO94DRAFT_535753 [Aspergillus sclerotioniger CBS 115572]